MKPASSPQDHDLIRLLKEIKSLPADYPPELLSARRAAFLDLLDEYGQQESRSRDGELIALLGRLRSVEQAYPARLLAARRSAFRRRILLLNLASRWSTFRSALRDRLAAPQEAAPLSRLRTSIVLAGLALAAAVGYFFQEQQAPALRPQPALAGVARSGMMVASDAREVKIICRPGFEPPLCLAGAYKKSQTLTFHGNGSARPAVAKDTFAGVGDIHRPAFVNDGLYGPGASWISASPNSWIKIDLGKPTAINMVTFGRDRLGEYNDGDPGQFVIQVAMQDNVYANGNNSNDSLEYQEVYNSEQAGFEGTISGAETVTAQFDLQIARYIKITFENAGTAIDEVEAFVIQPPLAANSPTRVREQHDPPGTATSAPTSTASATDTATSLPTSTAVPTDTPVPTVTPVPTDTPTPLPTNTPVPTDTPAPTDTALPEPTDIVTAPEETYIFERVDLELYRDWPPGLERNPIRPTRHPHFSN